MGRHPLLMFLNTIKVLDDIWQDMQILKSTVLVSGILLLMFAPLDPSTYASGQSALEQDTNMIFSPPPPAPFDQLHLNKLLLQQIRHVR